MLLLTPYAAGHSHRGWLLLASVIAGLTIGIMVTVFGDKGDNPTFRMVRCSMGFLVAVVWIMAIADEVVDVLQASDPSFLSSLPLMPFP